MMSKVIPADMIHAVSVVPMFAPMMTLTFDLEHWTIKAEYVADIPTPDKQPLEAENVYIVGDATPNGWSIDEPTKLEKVSQYIFKYEGELVNGELKACLQTGDWGVSFIRPAFGGCKINKSGVESEEFVFTTNPDDKWQVEEAGQYRLTFDLEHWTSWLAAQSW